MDSPPPVKSPIASGLDDLFDALQSLDINLSNLADKVSSVVVNSSTEASVGPPQSVNGYSGLCKNLQLATEQVNAYTTRIKTLIASIEL